MPFTPETKNPGDIIRSAEWNAALTAIAALFAKLDPTNGHRHTGGVEDGPLIGATGLADNAVTANKIATGAVTAAKIADGSVNAAKIADGSVTTAKIADGSVNAAKIADGSVTTAELANLAVTTDKIANAAITAAKLAAGVASQIGIAITMGVFHGQTIPIPSGFTRDECIFMAALKYVNVSSPPGGIINCTVDSNGVVTISPDGYGVAMGAAFGKKGGW